MPKTFADCSREELLAMLHDAAKNWLAHDGCWFLAAEERFDMETAIALDCAAWARFTVVEAKRIMKRHGIEKGGGLEALEQALHFRLYALLNRQEVVREAPDRLVLRMRQCRVQHARQRDNRPDFPCKPVGLVEYAEFARTIDACIQTECLCCPPDPHPADLWCAWVFSLG